MYIGFDIGGSSVKAVLVKDKKIINSTIKDTPDNLEGLLSLLKKMFDELKEGVDNPPAGGAGVGVALAGAIDVKREMMLNSPNITYLNDQPVKKLISEKLGYEVKIENDINCFLFAEREVGKAKELKDVFYVAVGTGVGGAFMINREIFIGAHGAAGEVGHTIIDLSDGLSLENLSGNIFFQKEMGVDGAGAEKLARSGDKKAQEITLRRANNLGVGLANIVNLFDPEAIIIGGGIVSAKDLILPTVKEIIDKHAISPQAKKTEIIFSELGRLGGALGAALLAEKE